MSKVRIGNMNRRVRLQVATETSDGRGGVVRTWNDKGDMWVSIEDSSSQEIFEARQVDSEVTHNLVGWYDERITSSHRLIYHDHRKNADRTFNVVSAVNPLEANETTRMVCKEDT